MLWVLAVEIKRDEPVPSLIGYNVTFSALLSMRGVSHPI